MNTLNDKALIYDSNCPTCAMYTDAFVKVGVLSKQGRLSFREADGELFARLDMQRARHEIPLVDTKTGEVVYGIDALMLIIAGMLPFTKPLVTKAWFKNMLRPLYKFISYNRRVIAGTAPETYYFDSAPDFNLGWRLALIITGITYTAFSIYVFALLTGIGNIPMLFAMVLCYFMLLLAVNLSANKTVEQKWDYVGHLATLGVIESSIFIATALLAKFTGYTGLLFAGQGAGRLFVLWIHNKRVQNNHYSSKLNYAFAAGAAMLIMYLAVIIK